MMILMQTDSIGWFKHMHGNSTLRKFGVLRKSENVAFQYILYITVYKPFVE